VSELFLPNVVGKLGDGDQSALNLGNLDTLGEVGLDDVSNGQEIRHSLTASPGKLADFLANGHSSTLEESGYHSMVLAEHELAEKMLLVSGLITEKKNFGHFD